MRTTGHLLAIIVAVATMAPTVVAAAEPTVMPQIEDQVLVRYRNDTTRAERSGLVRQLGLTVVRGSHDGRTQVVSARGESPATIRRQLLDDPRVLAVGPNHQRELADEITDEPEFPSQWGIHNAGQFLDGTTAQIGIADVDIDGLEALRITHGDPGIVVAVIDNGIDFSHPDLAGRAWTNPHEIAGNGIDDDSNGHVDDIRGWDFCNDDASLHDAGQDGHGTHVAGTIAASLNGTGVLGVAPGVKVMAVKFIDDGSPCGTDDMAVAAIDYAASFGVPIINASWGGADPGEVLDQAILESQALFVAAAGNSNQNIDSDLAEFYPAESTLANILSVAAIDQRGNRAPFSNYGAASVDIGAPGTNILSTYPGGNAWSAGTSMAAPHVSGVAALVAGVMTGTPTPAVLKARILGRGTPLASMVGKTVTGRLLNAWRAIDVTGPLALPVDVHRINAGTIIGTSIGTTILWPAASDVSGVSSYLVRRRIGTGAWTTIASAATTRSLKPSLTFGSPYRFGVAGRDRVGNVGAQVDGPLVTASLFGDGTSLAKYSGKWSIVSSSAASGGRLHSSTRTGAAVEFRATARAIGVVGRKRPGSGQVKVYVDGTYVQTIDLNRSTTQSKVVLFSRSWTTPGTHTVKLVVVGTAGRPRVEIDAFPILR